MGIFKNILGSNKVRVTLVSLILAVLTASGVVVPAGSESVLLAVIGLICGSYNVGQGIADGLSQGKTSLSATNRAMQVNVSGLASSMATAKLLEVIADQVNKVGNLAPDAQAGKEIKVEQVDKS